MNVNFGYSSQMQPRLKKNCLQSNIQFGNMQRIQQIITASQKTYAPTRVQRETVESAKSAQIHSSENVP
jgi:hypothetical protein